MSHMKIRKNWLLLIFSIFLAQSIMSLAETSTSTDKQLIENITLKEKIKALQEQAGNVQDRYQNAQRQQERIENAKEVDDYLEVIKRVDVDD